MNTPAKSKPQSTVLRPVPIDPELLAKLRDYLDDDRRYEAELARADGD